MYYVLYKTLTDCLLKISTASYRDLQTKKLEANYEVHKNEAPTDNYDKLNVKVNMFHYLQNNV